MTISVAADRPVNLERRYYMAMILAIIACVLVGFSRSVFLRPLFPRVHAPTEIWFYVHGAVFIGWLGLLLTQASLIGAGNRALHIRLGVAGFVIVPLMVFLGVVGSLIAARRPSGFTDIALPPLEFLVVPIYNIALFALFAGLGLAFRKTPQTHKRLILLAAIALTEAAIARFQFEPFLSSPPAAFWASTLFLVPMIGWDIYSRRSLHPVTIWGGLLLVTQGPLRDMLSHMQAWMTFAKWATGLLG
jgi:hypothetical protein